MDSLLLPFCFLPTLMATLLFLSQSNPKGIHAGASIKCWLHFRIKNHTHASMEKGAAGGDDPARVAGGMCDRFLTFLAKNLSMNRHKAITEGPRNGGGGGGGRQLEGGEEDEDDDEFAIRIERAEFDFELGGHGDDGPTGVTTVLEDVSTAAATASDEQRQKGAAAAADRPVAVAETKVRKTMTIKEDRPEEVAGGGNKGAAVLEKKKSMFKRRQASSSLGAGGEEQGGRAPRRSGLRPRMPAVLRVPSNIDERSSTFIKERRKIFGGAGNPAPADK